MSSHKLNAQRKVDSYDPLVLQATTPGAKQRGKANLEVRKIPNQVALDKRALSVAGAAPQHKDTTGEENPYFTCVITSKHTHTF